MLQHEADLQHAAARLDLDARIAPGNIENHDACIGDRCGVVTTGAR